MSGSAPRITSPQATQPIHNGDVALYPLPMFAAHRSQATSDAAGV